MNRLPECNYDTKDPVESRTAALKRENETLKCRVDQLGHELERLKAMPDDQAIDFLRTLRSTPEPMSTLSAVGGSEIPLATVTHTTSAPAALPPLINTNQEVVVCLRRSHSLTISDMPSAHFR